MPIEFLTAGESHGKGLTAIINGIPAGFNILEEDINKDLRKRQKGYGRGGRMKIESDSIEILSGIRHGITTGAPISLWIENKDWENWKVPMDEKPVNLEEPDILEQVEKKKITHVRPGHADFAGALKYGHSDVRNVLERSSARETAARVSVGAVARKILEAFNIKIGSHVIEIGGVKIQKEQYTFDDIVEASETSELRCIDPEATEEMKRKIQIAAQDGNTLGGVIEIIAMNVPLGLGSYSQWNKRIDGILAQYVMSIPAIKSFEVGMGKAVASLPGSEVHDPFALNYPEPFFYRLTNNAGGIEGGITNGNPIVLRATMKPIPTMKRPLRSIDLETKKEHEAHYERSDICAVPAAGIVCEAMVALALLDQFLVKFGGDSFAEINNNFQNYLKPTKSRL